MISKKSGHVFEKRLIEKYIADHGKNPVTGDSLSAEDLVEVQGWLLLFFAPLDHGDIGAWTIISSGNDYWMRSLEIQEWELMDLLLFMFFQGTRP